MKTTLPNGWENVELGDVTDCLDEKRIPLNSEDRSKMQGNIPYYGANGQIDSIDKHIFDEELLLLAEDGGSWGPHQNCSYVINGKSWVNNHAHVLKMKKEIDISYLMYFLNHHDLNRFISGTTRGKLNQGVMKKILIVLPPLMVQKQMVSILEKVEKVREDRNDADKLTKDLLKAIFLEMFCSSNADGWKEVMIKDLASPKKASMRTGPFGSDLKHGEFVERGIAVLGIDNAVNNHFEWKQRRFITKEKYEKLKRYRIYPRDIIITIMATIGRSAVIPDDIPIAINTKHLAAITLDEKKANPYFLSYSIHSNPYVLSQLNSNNRGAIMAGLNLSIIKELKIKLPPLQLQNQFEKIYDQITYLERFQNQSKEHIENLFNNVVRKSFKGELAC